MRRVFRRLIRRVNTTEWSVSWFEVLPGEDPAELAEQIHRDPAGDDPAGGATPGEHIRELKNPLDEL